jgi:hypothetical protein
MPSSSPFSPSDCNNVDADNRARWSLDRLVRGIPPPRRESPFRLNYSSQLAYPAPHGHTMCTAVCYAAAHAFLMHGALGGARIDAIMQACHTMCAELKLTRPLMLAEMQEWFPTPLPVAEVAGLTTSGDTSEIDEGHLLLMPLDELLGQMHSRTGTRPIALLITLQEHTRMVLSSGNHHQPQRAPSAAVSNLLLFDPLLTALQPLPAGTRAQLALGPLALPGEKVPYAGVMLSVQS